MTYFGKDANRNFKILVNGEVIANPKLMGAEGAKFFEVDYQLPKKLVVDNEILTVRFEAEEGSSTAGVYGVRLINTTKTKK